MMKEQIIEMLDKAGDEKINFIYVFIKSLLGL